jgi:phosphoglycolate phosphatase
VSDFRLLIFDWDGTLVDSIARIVESIQVAAACCELPPLPAEPIKAIIGLSLSRAIDVLYPQFDDPLGRERFRQAYADHYLALEEQPSPLFPGVAEALQAFRREGLQLAVATGKSRRGLHQVLARRGWLDFFDITRCADETSSKPHPQMLEEILAHCGVPAHRALMVGDSRFDLQMAHNAGVHAVAVGYGAQSLASLRAEAPHLEIEHFDQLRAWLGVPLDREVKREHEYV